MNRAPGRPLTEAVRRECGRIGELIARGCSEADIRAELRLSRRAFDDRMERLKKLAVSRHALWARFLAAQQADIAVLSAIVDDEPDAAAGHRRGVVL
jgi:hypothetical protein